MKKQKQLYRKPEVKAVRLDREISLILSSEPPFGPDETYNQNIRPDYLSKNQYV
jgi:hypothetical protein